MKSYEPTSVGDIGYFEDSKKRLGYRVKSSILGWVKNIVKWWSAWDHGDGEFVNAIQYLIRDGIVDVDFDAKPAIGNSTIPAWIKKMLDGRKMEVLMMIPFFKEFNSWSRKV